MPAPSWLSRLGHSRSFRLIGSYLAASWVVLQLTALLREELDLQPRVDEARRAVARLERGSDP